MTTFNEMPYFMSNPEWYTEVEDGYDPETDTDRGYRLTDKAPQEAIDSYNEFYERLENSVQVFYQ